MNPYQTRQAGGPVIGVTKRDKNLCPVHHSLIVMSGPVIANGNTFAYDARKRLTVTTYPDSTTTVNAYDGPGNLASVTDQAGNLVQYTYDAANQLKTVVQTASPNTANNTN